LGHDNRRPWNAGTFVGAKRPQTPKKVWKLSFHLECDERVRALALFDLAIGSKRRGCDATATGPEFPKVSVILCRHGPSALPRPSFCG
jgi:hypothetical protein